MPVGHPPSATQVLADRRAPQRDSILAGMAQIRTGAQPADAPAAAAPTQPATPSTDAPVTEDPPAAPEATPPAEDPAPATPAAEPPAAEPPGMAMLRKQEQHMRRQLAEERQKLQTEIEQMRREHQTRIDRAAQTEQRLEAIKRDPATLIQLLADAGYGEADFDPLGRYIWGHSTEGKAKGGAAASAADVHRTAAQRQQQTELQKLQNEFNEFKKSATEREQRAAVKAELDRYVSTVAKAASDETPLAKAALTKAPERTQQKLLEVAHRLYIASGPSDDLRDEPSPSEVLKAYEAERAAELEELGIDVKALRAGAKPTPPTPPAPTPPAQRPATTLAPSGGAAPTPAREPEAKMSRDEVLANLAKLRSTGSLG